VNLGWGVLAAMVVGGLYANIVLILACNDPDDGRSSPRELLRLAEEVRRTSYRVDATTPIAARKPHIGYHLGAPVISIPTGTVDDFREAGAHYLLISGREAFQYPDLAPLTYPQDPTRIPNGLDLVARTLVFFGKEDTPRSASLYAIENPLPHNPPGRRPRPIRDRSTLLGLDRLDYLRLRLVRWHLAWLSSYPRERIFDQLSEQARRHPEVLLTLGDHLLTKVNPEEAERRYEEALEAGLDDPTRVWNRIASLRFLAGDIRGVERALAEVRGDPAAMEPSARFAVIRQVGLDAFARLEYPEAIGPLAACTLMRPTDAFCWKVLSVCLMSMKWNELAKVTCATYLELVPGDQEIRLRLDKLDQGSPEAVK
jgi:hypothetical protein